VSLHAHIDFETRSAVDLKKTGAYAYMADPTTDVWCAAYAIGDGPIETWLPGQPCPGELEEHILLGGTIVAHNAAFERQVFRYIMGPRYDWPVPAVEQWRCTMATAYALALPGSLENAAAAAGLSSAKDMAGHRLMMQMARPRKVNDDGTIVWWDDPDKLARLVEYCRTDVEVERALEKRLRPLSESELALWHLDQRINDRGVLVDEPLANAAKRIVAQAQKNLDRQMRELTSHVVTACSNRNQIVTWVRGQGVECDSLAKAAMETLLEQDDVALPPHVRNVLLVRQESAKASVAKIDALLNGKSPEDDRAKGLLQFHAASTGRWGGRRFQPQNIKRPDEGDIDTLIDVVAEGDHDYLAMLYDKLLSAVADTLRGMIRAAPGHRIVAADHSNIEGRVLAWLAGEEWKLQAFREFDSGTGHDLYKITAGGILGKKPEDVTKAERQSHGKVPELALGYQGGVGAFSTMAANYGVDLDRVTIEAIRDGWREKHPAIKGLWYAMEEAAVAAVQDRGSTHRVGRIAFRVAGSWLFMRLPSGRFLAYPYPEVREFDVPWGGTKPGLTYFSTIDVSKKAKVVDDALNSSNWARIKTYGGMLVENATQAVARDVLADAMPRLEAAGYPIVLTVHDEIVCEVPDGHGSVSEMEEIMCDLPAWARGLPVAAEGFEGERYRK
jgi:DNA polymerase bacteriophage-type